jgi:uncharacterized protein YukE
VSVELGQTSNPIDLVPGAPTSLFESATSWRLRAETANDVAERLASFPTPEGWEGEAADAFDKRLRDVADAWTRLGQVLSGAADGIEQYATTLGWAQQKAGDAIAMWNAAQSLTAQGVQQRRDMERLAGPTDILPPAVDGGEPLRAEARALLGYARAEVLTAGDSAASALRTSADMAPPAPDPWAVAGAVASAIVDVQVTIQWNALVDVVNGVASFGNALIQNPELLLAILGGGAMIGGGAGLMGGGGAVSLTGAGAAVGVPAAAGGYALAGAGVAVAGVGATAAAIEAMGASRVELLERRGEDRGDGRDDEGHFVGSDNKPWVDKEKQGLDELEEVQGQPVVRDKVRAQVEGGNPNGRYYDGLIENADGTYTAAEIKSGGAGRTPEQRQFDDAVNSGTPAEATLNGKKITIVNVILKVVP